MIKWHGPALSSETSFAKSNHINLIETSFPNADVNEEKSDRCYWPLQGGFIQGRAFPTPPSRAWIVANQS